MLNRELLNKLRNTTLLRHVPQLHRRHGAQPDGRQARASECRSRQKPWISEIYALRDGERWIAVKNALRGARNPIRGGLPRLLLRRQFGRARWRKLKGIATIRLARGVLRRAELHWYEAHGIGRRKLKIKRFLE